MVSNVAARVGKWVESSFGWSVLVDRKERARRVLEEAIELAQAEDVAEIDAMALVAHVYKRTPGNPNQEAAGVMVTMQAWAFATNQDVDGLMYEEIVRIESIPAETFRKRQLLKSEAGVAMAPEVTDGL